MQRDNHTTGDPGEYFQEGKSSDIEWFGPTELQANRCTKSKCSWCRSNHIVGLSSVSHCTMKQVNQNKPNPPLALIEPHIMELWQARLSDKQILAKLHKVFDTTQYGLGRTKFRTIHKSLGLFRTREQAHDPESIRGVMLGLREAYPRAGEREMISHMFHSHGILVSQ
ncbi:hypothetical protein J3R83DRAFT_4073 [Lanmaoa asiatica]|nr:hypothetical protein J3R83DRAFT_4073 [Lanmaoa asiatica]